MKNSGRYKSWPMMAFLAFMVGAVCLSALQIVSPIPAYALDCDHNCGSSGGHACETGCDLCHSGGGHNDFNCKKHTSGDEIPIEEGGNN